MKDVIIVLGKDVIIVLGIFVCTTGLSMAGFLVYLKVCARKVEKDMKDIRKDGFYD